MFNKYEMELAGKKLIIETGKMALQSNGSVVVKYGETTVMTNVTAAKQADENIDFFPLSVDYEEKLYSVGKIPGSYSRREGKPADSAILISRAIDRPIRPLFPEDFRNSVCIVNTVISNDQDNSPEVAAQIGTSVALSISDIPWNGPSGAVAVGLVDDEIIINPNNEQRQKSKLKLTVAGTENKITMIEAGADEIPNELMLKAIKKAHVYIKQICEFIKNIQSEIGKEKFEYKSFSVNKDLYKKVETEFLDEIKLALKESNKVVRKENISKIEEKIEKVVEEFFGDEYEENKFKKNILIHDIEKQATREIILKEKVRPDGRGLQEVRKLTADVDLFPRVHGSGLFSRGETQVLTITTLGTKGDSQEIDGIDNELVEKRYMHQYNFPSYSVGEARQSRGPGRREIGHGALAEKALIPVLPSEEEFPYTIRLVSEVLGSNGSTSQASICASTLSLMDAGVPIKRPVAGISTGLITDKDDENNYIVITDIQDIEDFFGDMDFKVGGTTKGITAIQVDIKNDGLTYDIIEKAFEQTENARLDMIENVILKSINEPRQEVSKYAPKIVSLKIEVDKIKDVIGSGGKVINKIIEETGVKIDIDDDGKVFIYSNEIENANKAKQIIENIVKEFKPGEIVQGKVLRITNFGAFIDLGFNKEGLLHISKISDKRIEKVESVLEINDSVKVKVIEVDDQGRINLTMKDLEEKKEEE